MVKKRGLGKSLDALLAYTGTSKSTIDDIPPVEEALKHLDIQLLERGKYQPRRKMDAESLQELANSIRHQGILQPLIVRVHKDSADKFEIIAGERRYQAALMAGLSQVPVIVRHIPDEAAMAIALIENIQRENLNPIEEALAFERLIKEFGLSHQQVADAVGRKSRTSVTNLLRLLTLPHDIKQMLDQGVLEMGHARALLSLPDTLQTKAAETIASKQLSVREAENVVRRLLAPTKLSSQTSKAPDLLTLQENLSQFLKLQVMIQCNAKGKGKVIIHYRNLSELDNLLAHIKAD